MKKLLGLLILLWPLQAWAGPAADHWTGLTDAAGDSVSTAGGVVPVTPTSSPSAAACKTDLINGSGVANASITVDNTAGGVAVLAAASTRCGAVILNSGSAAMRCAPTTVTVTTTVGFLVVAGAAITLGTDGQQAWNCIRTTSTSTTADVIEAKP